MEIRHAFNTDDGIIVTCDKEAAQALAEIMQTSATKKIFANDFDGALQVLESWKKLTEAVTETTAE